MWWNAQYDLRSLSALASIMACLWEEQRALERRTSPSSRYKYFQIYEIITDGIGVFLRKNQSEKKITFTLLLNWDKGKTKLSPWPCTYLKMNLFVQSRADSAGQLRQKTCGHHLRPQSQRWQHLLKKKSWKITNPAPLHPLIFHTKPGGGVQLEKNGMGVHTRENSSANNL